MDNTENIIETLINKPIMYYNIKWYLLKIIKTINNDMKVNLPQMIIFLIKNYFDNYYLKFEANINDSLNVKEKLFSTEIIETKDDILLTYLDYNITSNLTNNYLFKFKIKSLEASYISIGCCSVSHYLYYTVEQDTLISNIRNLNDISLKSKNDNYDIIFLKISWNHQNMDYGQLYIKTEHTDWIDVGWKLSRELNYHIIIGASNCIIKVSCWRRINTENVRIKNFG